MIVDVCDVYKYKKMYIYIYIHTHDVMYDTRHSTASHKAFCHRAARRTHQRRIRRLAGNSLRPDKRRQKYGWSKCQDSTAHNEMELEDSGFSRCFENICQDPPVSPLEAQSGAEGPSSPSQHFLRPNWKGALVIP